jgi:hypothetical protein
MAHAARGGGAAPQQLPGLQVCDISDIEFDSATEPKEGGFGNSLRLAKLSLASASDEFKCNFTCDCMSNAVPHFVAGLVLRAFLNGTEAAVKRPKIKVTLNPRDLKKFTQEVTTMLKVSNALRPLS